MLMYATYVCILLGHTKLMLCFTDYLPSQSDPAGREKNKNVNYIDRSK